MPAQIKCRSKPRGLTHGSQEQTTFLLSGWLRKAFCILPCVGMWLCCSWRWGGTAFGGHSCFPTCPLPHRGSAWEVPGLVPRPAGACTHLFSPHHPKHGSFQPHNHSRCTHLAASILGKAQPRPRILQSLCCSPGAQATTQACLPTHIYMQETTRCSPLLTYSHSLCNPIWQLALTQTRT